MFTFAFLFCLTVVFMKKKKRLFDNVKQKCVSLAFDNYIISQTLCLYISKIKIKRTYMSSLYIKI